MTDLNDDITLYCNEIRRMRRNIRRASAALQEFVTHTHELEYPDISVSILKDFTDDDHMHSHRFRDAVQGLLYDLRESGGLDRDTEEATAFIRYIGQAIDASHALELMVDDLAIAIENRDLARC